jgi:hypothetical protein
MTMASARADRAMLYPPRLNCWLWKDCLRLSLAAAFSSGFLFRFIFMFGTSL